MSIVGLEARGRARASLLSGRVLPVYAATVFTSALLLFSLEPMFAKMTLPVLGGSPSVWSVAMVFFQALMFAGYCYAHALTRWVAPRSGALFHLALLAVAALTLPVTLRASSAPPDEGNPAFWLIGVFTASVGLPFFALSAQGPLLQAWFARSGHVQARDPYFLYGASNIGSFVALLAYPFLVEPLSGLLAQSASWTIGFLAMVLMMAICALAVFGPGAAGSPPATIATAVDTGETAVPLKRLAACVGLAFVPSALLVSVTAHVSTEVAAAPLLWVVPLGLYLLTFVLTFRSKPVMGDFAAGASQSWLAAIVVMAACAGVFANVILGLAIHLSLFFVNAMICHGALYRLRPRASDLTVFYAAMSLGGALGGVFAGLVAPALFPSLVEYPLLIAAAMACRAGVIDEIRTMDGASLRRMAATAIALPVVALALALTTITRVESRELVLAACAGAAILLNWRGPGRAAILGASAAITVIIAQNCVVSRESWRSFFGVHRVEEVDNGQFRTLAHGATMHGSIRVRNADGTPVSGRPVGATYYTKDGPISEAIAAARVRQGSLAHTAIIGLGAGALACAMRDDEGLTYYEIDPLVVYIARDSGRFRYISDCAPQSRFVVGDARLTMTRQPGASNVIVIDAFSSDAIPMHLLTREAFELYLSKLAPEGMIVVHISNNMMEFSGVIARIAAELGLHAFVRRDQIIDKENTDMRTPSIVAVVTRDPSHAGALLREGGDWSRVRPDMKSRPWTDDYSTILTAIAAKWRP